jgi:MFS family permease
MISGVVMGVAMFPIVILTAKFGRRKTMMGGIVLLAVSLALGRLITEASQVGWMYVVFSFIGVGWAAITVNGLPMVVQICTAKDVGKFTGFYYAASMSAQGLAAIIAGLVLAPDAMGQTFMFPMAAIFVALSFITMIFVKHGDSEPVKPHDDTPALETVAADDTSVEVISEVSNEEAGEPTIEGSGETNE